MTLLSSLYSGAGGGISNMVEDTTPQLGGNLDMNGHSVGGNTEAQLDDAVSKKHTANADTDLDSTFEATFVKKADTINVLSDITSTGANIEDAVTKKHAATLIGTKTIDEIDIGNAKVIAYNSTSGNLEYETAGGGGDVTAAANIDANAVVVGDDGAKGVKKSVVSISDAGAITGAVSITRATGGAFDIAIGSAAGDDFTVDANKLVVEGDTGKVGIGWSTPDTRLHINGGIGLGGGSSINGTGHAFELNTDNTFGSTNNDHTGIRMFAYDMNGWETAKLGIQVSDGWSSYIGDDSPTKSNMAMVIGQTETIIKGNVGIGTTLPNEKLTVEGAVSLDEISAPSHTAGYGKIYVKSSDGLPYFKKHEGTEYELTGGGGGNWTDQGTYYYPNNWSNFKIYDTGKLKISSSSDGEILDSFSSWTSTLSENYDALRVDVGSYGINNEFHGGAHILSGLVGAVNIPSNSVLAHCCAGISGYAKTAKNTTFAVGGYFQGQVKAAGTSGTRIGAWGSNPLVEDLGHNYAVIYGEEINVNCTNANSWVFGLNVIGGSSVEPPVSRAVDISALGEFTTPKKRWHDGLFVRDGACINGIHLGTEREGNNYGSHNIEFVSRTAGGAEKISDIVNSADGALWIRNKTGSQLMAAFAPGSSTYLHFSGSEKLKTTATGITVTGSCSGCDYVFEPNYSLLSLDNLGKFVENNKHLPNLTIAQGYKIDISTMREELVAKVEEQALYILQLHERLKILEEK